MSEKIELGLPEKLKLFHHGSYIEIVRTWFGWQIVILAVFVIIWNSSLFEIFSKNGLGGDLKTNVVGSLFIATGICMTYFVVASLFNRTHIFVSPGKIAVRHRPIPWFGNKELAAMYIKQLYSKENISRSRKGTNASYEVHVITKNGRNMKLISGLETSEQAVYIEQEIEKYLHIEDISVRGEI